MRFSYLRSHFFRQPLKVGIALLLPLLGFAQLPMAPSTPVIETPQSLKSASIQFPESALIRPTKVAIQKARLGTESVTVQPGDYAVTLLADNGIRQDAKSLALLYELNPQLEDVRKIMAGEKLVVPEIEGTRTLEFAFRRGYRVELLMDQLTATRTLGERTGQIKSLEFVLAGLAAERFNSREDRTEVSEIVKDALAALTILASPEPNMVISRKVAIQAAVEGEAIRSKISSIIASGRSISMADVHEIKANADNLKAIGQEIMSGGSGLVRTTIRTKNATDGQPVAQLTVWYTPAGDRNQKRPCSMASSPTVEAIARGDYIFWATRGSEVVTEEKPRRIRSATKDDPLDLLVR